MKLPSGCMGVNPRLVHGPCVAGLDIRPGSYDLTIGDAQRPRPDVTVPRLVFAGKLPGAEECIWVMRQYRTRYGLEDCRPETSDAKRIQRQCQKVGIEMWRAQYNTAPSSIEVQENEREGLLTLERTMTLDNVLHAFQTGLGIAIPQNFREITSGEWVNEMCASTRVLVQWHGLDAYQWKESGADHAMHSLNLLLVGFHRGKFGRGGAEAMMAMKGIVEGSLPENIEDDEDAQDEFSVATWQELTA